MPIPAPTPIPIPMPTPMPTDLSCADGHQNGDESDIDCSGGCPACDVGYGCSSSSDCTSDACDTPSGICLTSMPTGLPSPQPALQATVTPCPWFEISNPPKKSSAKFSPTGGQLFLP